MPSSFSQREKIRDARRMRASLRRRSSRIILMILSVPPESPNGDAPLDISANTSTESKGRMESRSIGNHDVR